ncbi:MAG: class I adenylate-forming enzyme family protein [Pseudomonadota bacterium]
MKTVADIEQELTAPGGAFEITTEEVLGEQIPVFKERDRSLRELLEKSAVHGDSPYIVCEGRRFTFEEHLHLVTRLARVLVEDFNIQPGDRVAILADNHPEWIFTFWATISVGGVCVGLNGWWQREEILYGLEDSDPKLLVADRKRLNRIQSDPLPCPSLCIEDDFEQLLRDAPSEDGLPEVNIAEDDAALILYTSGTTGLPKGALISHRGLITFFASTVFSGLRMMMLEMEAGKLPSPDAPPHCGLFSAPLFHLSGLFTGVITSLGVGMKTVWTVGRFDPEKVLRLIEQEKVTTWAALGSMGARVLNHPEFHRYDVSSVSRLGSGGAPTSERQQQLMTQGFSGTGGQMAVGYGLTESTGVGTHNWGALLEEHPNSVGRVFPGIQISIRDDHNNPLPVGSEGEICIRGSCVMLGYWRKPEATAAAIAPGRWLRTGDIGHFEGDFLYINTRARDLILRNAENIYPVEVEHCLELHPDIAEAAVVGVPHDEWGQAVMAFLVPADNLPASDSLRDFCMDRLASYKVPTQWQFLDAPLPRNAAGKILKNVLLGEVENRLTEE